MTRDFPIGRRISLPGHFPEPVVLESLRPIGAGYECRVRLADWTRSLTAGSKEGPGGALDQWDEANA